MLFIGITIYSVNLKQFKFSADILVLFLGRFLISPMMAYMLCILSGTPSLMKKVFVIQAAMPAMTNTAVVSRNCNADYEYASVNVVLTTISSMLIIPIYMLLLN